MSDLTLGFTVALVGMLGTLLALSLLAVVIYALHRAFPPIAEAERPTPNVPGPK